MRKTDKPKTVRAGARRNELQLTPDEIALVRDYRVMPLKDRLFIGRLANALQEDAGAIPPAKLLIVDGERK